MAIPTSRTKDKAEIKIDVGRCTGCGKCVSVCKDFSLYLSDQKVKVSRTPVFGCIACGHCMAVCPTGAIEVAGRCLSKEDLFDLPSKERSANYLQLLNLFRRRRSIREFSDKPVTPEMIQKILNAAVTSPMGIPPSDVHVMILDSSDKTRQFAVDFCNYLASIKWLVSGWFLTILRPFSGKTNDEMFRQFIKPLFNETIRNMQKGINLITYDAPLAMYFYGSSYSDPADPIVAATTAMMAGESLGLGTCMLGCIHPMIQYGKKAKRFREKYRIKNTCREGVFVIFGYPAMEYQKGIRRTFASISFS